MRVNDIALSNRNANIGDWLAKTAEIGRRGCEQRSELRDDDGGRSQVLGRAWCE